MLNSLAGKGTKGFFPVDKVYRIRYMGYGIRDTAHASHKGEVNIRFKKKYQTKGCASSMRILAAHRAKDLNKVGNCFIV